MKNKYIFVIDTDSYSGNFERDLCAYVTGIVGECGVGEEYADLYNKEVNRGETESIFLDYIEQRADEHGCLRPTAIWKTKGWLCIRHNKAVRMEIWNQEEADAAFQKENVKTYQGYYNMYAKYDIKDPAVINAGWTEETLKQHLEKCRKDIEKARTEKAPKQEPYNSVAIFFEKKPTTEMINLMKNRATNFAEAKRTIGTVKNYSWDKNFQLFIHGFRLIKETLEETEENI